MGKIYSHGGSVESVDFLNQSACVVINEYAFDDLRSGIDRELSL